MVTLGNTLPTLAGLAKMYTEDGKMLKLVDMLALTDEMTADIPFYETNQTSSHLVSVLTGYPSATWTLFNQGTPITKATHAQLTETVGMLSSRAQVDQRLAELNGNVMDYRFKQARPFVNAMGNQFAQTWIYGNYSTSPEQYNGLSVRFNSLSAGTGANIIDAGGTGTDNTSIWIIGFGENSIYGLYPKGSKIGLQHEDLGLLDAPDANKDNFRAYTDLWSWNAGMAIEDWRYIVRIANIDVSNLVAESSAADISKLVMKALNRVPNLTGAKFGIYVNRTVKEMWGIQTRNDVKAGGGLTYDNADGRPVASAWGIPVRTTDSILITEPRIV